MTAPTPVFVVDDDWSVRESLAILLHVLGWPVHTYPSAEDFLATLDANPAGCVLLDWNMPGMGGPELLRHLTSHHPALSVIVMSGQCDHELTAAALQAGALACLEKPFFERVLDEHLRKAAARNAGT